MNKAVLNLPVPQAFSFDECLIFLNRSPLECLHRVVGQTVIKALRVKDDNILFQLDFYKKQLRITFLNGLPEEAQQLAVVTFVKEWLDVDRDLSRFYEICEKDPLLQGLPEAYYGLRLVAIPDLLESLSWAIIGQQINLRFAYTMKARLVELCGEKIHFEGQDYWVFPEAAQIARLSDEALREAQFSRQKIVYLRNVVDLMNNGALKKDDLRSLEKAEILDALIAIKGVGEWTANYVLMKCFRHPEAFPWGDVGLHNAIKERLQWSRKPTTEEIMTFAEGWRHWEAYATFYLWRFLI